MLQNLIGSLTEALKAVNTRLDQQAETTRKAFADQKLVIDNLTNDVRRDPREAGRQQRPHRLAHAGSRLAAAVAAAGRAAAVGRHADGRQRRPMRRRAGTPAGGVARAAPLASRRRSCSTRR